MSISRWGEEEDWYFGFDHEERLERQRQQGLRHKPKVVLPEPNPDTEDTEDGFILVTDSMTVVSDGNQFAYTLPNTLEDAAMTVKHIGIQTASSIWRSATWANMEKLAERAKDIAGTTVNTIAATATPLSNSPLAAASKILNFLEPIPTISPIEMNSILPPPTRQSRGQRLRPAIHFDMEDQVVPRIGRRHQRDDTRVEQAQHFTFYRPGFDNVSLVRSDTS